MRRFDCLHLIAYLGLLLHAFIPLPGKHLDIASSIFSHRSPVCHLGVWVLLFKPLFDFVISYLLLANCGCIAFSRRSLLSLPFDLCILALY